MHHTYIYIFIHISRIKTSLSQYSILRSFLFSISHYFPRRSLRPEIGRSDATTPDSLHPPTWPSANPRLLLLRYLRTREVKSTRSHAIGAKVLSKVQPWRGEEAGQTFDECRNSTKGGGGNYGWLNGSRNSVGRCFTRDT